MALKFKVKIVTNCINKGRQDPWKAKEMEAENRRQISYTNCRFWQSQKIAWKIVGKKKESFIYSSNF